MSKMRTVLMSAMLGTALVTSVVGATAPSPATNLSPQAAASDKWVLLAERTAGKLTGQDTMMLPPPYQNFHSLKFTSRDAAVHVKYFLATFDNGAVERVEVDQKVERDGESLPIKLPNVGQKKLTQIRVTYDTAGILRDAKVSLYGMK
jgi:hypothetical protein